MVYDLQRLRARGFITCIPLTGRRPSIPDAETDAL
jgi:hypothetical protein